MPVPVRPDRVAPDVTLPETWRVDRLEMLLPDTSGDTSAQIDHALARPLASLALSELAGEGSRVTIVCGALFNGSPDGLLVPAMIGQLRGAGVRTADISLLVASDASHRVTAPQARHALGQSADLAGRVVVNDPGDHASHASLGNVDGLVVRVHHLAAEADLLIATGAVSPDEYAGYTGGADVIALGCADGETQRALRSARFLDDAAVRAGQVRENPFQGVLREVARRAGLLFVVNALLDPDTRVPVAFAAGAPIAVHDSLVRLAVELYEPEAPGAAYDVVVLTEGDDLRRTLFDASPGIAASALASRPVLRAQGILIAEARCAEPFPGFDPRASAGRLAESSEFYQALAGANTADVLLRQLRDRSLRPGEERAYRMAQALSAGARIVLCDPLCVDKPGYGFSTARTMAEAAEIAESFVGHRPRALIVPQRGRRLPVASERPPPGGADNPFGAWGSDEF